MRCTMNNEKTRLDKMLNEHKISQEDYSVLSKALHRKAFYTKMQSQFWLNPFQKIAGSEVADCIPSDKPEAAGI